jgi:hypothetical protein
MPSKSRTSDNALIVKSLNDARNLLLELIGNDRILERIDAAIALLDAVDVLVKAAEDWAHMLTVVSITDHRLVNHDEGSKKELDEQLRVYERCVDELRAALDSYGKLAASFRS